MRSKVPTNIKMAIRGLEAAAQFLQRLQALLVSEGLEEVQAPKPKRPGRPAQPQPHLSATEVLNHWRGPVLSVLRTKAEPMSSRQVRRYVADMRQLDPESMAVAQAVRSTLYNLKKEGAVAHDLKTGLYWLPKSNHACGGKRKAQHPPAAPPAPEPTTEAGDVQSGDRDAS